MTEINDVSKVSSNGHFCTLLDSATVVVRRVLTNSCSQLLCSLTKSTSEQVAPEVRLKLTDTCNNCMMIFEKKTSRERPKSASYRGLNNLQGKTQPIVKFFIYHTVSKNPKRVFPETRKQFFSALETSEKTTNLPSRKIKIFQKSIW